MAKADDTTSTSDFISLREAVDLAFAVFGSAAGAKEQLTEWLAAGELPWDCMRWKALDAAGIAELNQSLAANVVFAVTPSGPYYKGDPRFWIAGNLKINWEDNAAWEDVMEGAHAWGIRVPRAVILALLPHGAQESEEISGTAAWIADEARRMKKAGEIPADIRITALAKALEHQMQKAAATNKSLRPITWRSIKNRLPEWGLWPITSIK